MSAPISRPAEHSAHPGRLWWLPPGGDGNGLDDTAWAPVLEISEHVVPDVLRALADAGVPGYAAPARSLGYRLPDRSRRSRASLIWKPGSSRSACCPGWTSARRWPGTCVPCMLAAPSPRPPTWAICGARRLGTARTHPGWARPRPRDSPYGRSPGRWAGERSAEHGPRASG